MRLETLCIHIYSTQRTLRLDPCCPHVDCLVQSGSPPNRTEATANKMHSPTTTSFTIFGYFYSVVLFIIAKYHDRIKEGNIKWRGDVSSFIQDLLLCVQSKAINSLSFAYSIAYAGLKVTCREQQA